MTVDQRRQLVNKMELACLKAAQYILKRAAGDEPVKENRKPDGSLVLDLDLESQRIILKELEATIPIVAEEDLDSHTLVKRNASYFVVDPIDGTSACKRFLRQLGGQVGFGPLLGLIEHGILVASCFYHVPLRTLVMAELGAGCFALTLDQGIPDSLPEKEKWSRLLVTGERTLQESGVIFYPSSEGEMELVRFLRQNKLIEVPFRFGGFANDCFRLAHGFEQIEIQYKLRAWDTSAILFAVEAGLKAVMDPAERAIPFSEWRVEAHNKVIIAPPNLIDQMVGYAKKVWTRSGENENN